MRFIEPPGATRYLDPVRKGIPKKLHKFLDEFSSTLAIGSGRQNYGRNVIHLDIVRGSGIDVIGDAHFLPFRTEAFDKVLIQQVLQYVDEPTTVVQEIARVLRNEGKVFCDVPFIYPHLGPKDYRRYSLNGLVHQFEERRFKVTEKGTDMGPSSIFSLLLRYYLSLLTSFNNQILFQLGWIGWGYLTFWIKYLDSVVARWYKGKADHIPAQVYVIAQKLKKGVTA